MMCRSFALINRSECARQSPYKQFLVRRHVMLRVSHSKLQSTVQNFMYVAILRSTVPYALPKLRSIAKSSFLLMIAMMCRSFTLISRSDCARQSAYKHFLETYFYAAFIALETAIDNPQFHVRRDSALDSSARTALDSGPPRLNYAR